MSKELLEQLRADLAKIWTKIDDLYEAGVLTEEEVGYLESVIDYMRRLFEEKEKRI